MADAYGQMAAGIGGSMLNGIADTARSNTAKSKAYTQQALENANTNKSLEKLNLENSIRTGYRVGILNIQRAQARKAATESAFGITKVKATLLGSNAANAAASGNTGASVSMVAQDIAKKMDEAAISVDQGAQTTEFNMDTQLTDITQAGIDSLQYARIMDYGGPQQDSLIMGALWAGANTAAQYSAQWQQANMKLNLKKE